MFSKLLRHELRHYRGLFAIMSIAVLVICLLVTLLSNHLMSKAVENPMSDVAGIGAVFGMLLNIGMFMLSAAYVAAVGILLIYRFYKRLYSDEGYLTFTLPATTHQILLSSLVTNVIWGLLAVVVEVICVFSLFYSMFRMTFALAGEVMQFTWREVFSEIGNSFDAGFFAAYGFTMISGAMFTMVLPLLSITIGALVAKKHKLLAGIGVYLGLNAVLSMLTGIISLLLNIGNVMFAETDMQTASIFMMLVPAVLYMGIAIGGYFLMHYFADRRLNLP